MKCLACSEDQPKFTYIGKDGLKIVRVCESVLRSIYGAKYDTRTEAYQKCGAYTSPDTFANFIDPFDKSKGYKLESDDPELIFPYNEYINANEFFSNFGQMSIPFMDGF